MGLIRLGLAAAGAACAARKLVQRRTNKHKTPNFRKNNTRPIGQEASQDRHHDSISEDVPRVTQEWQISAKCGEFHTFPFEGEDLPIFDSKKEDDGTWSACERSHTAAAHKKAFGQGLNVYYKRFLTNAAKLQLATERQSHTQAQLREGAAKLCCKDAEIEQLASQLYAEFSGKALLSEQLTTMAADNTRLSDCLDDAALRNDKLTSQLQIAAHTNRQLKASLNSQLEINRQLSAKKAQDAESIRRLSQALDCDLPANKQLSVEPSKQIRSRTEPEAQRGQNANGHRKLIERLEAQAQTIRELTERLKESQDDAHNLRAKHKQERAQRIDAEQNEQMPAGPQKLIPAKRPGRYCPLDQPQCEKRSTVEAKPQALDVQLDLRPVKQSDMYIPTPSPVPLWQGLPGQNHSLAVISLEALTEVKRLGEGGCARVVSALHQEFSTRMAVKFVPYQGIPAERDVAIQTLHRELDVFSRAAAIPHLVTPQYLCMGLHEEDAHTIIGYVLPLMKGGSMWDVLRRLFNAETTMPIRHVLEIALQIGTALADLHQRGIYHNDTTPANVLVEAPYGVDDADATKASPVVRLSDFGSARIEGEPESTSIYASGCALPYAAPEVLQGQAVSSASDVYTFGLFVLDIITSGLYSFYQPQLKDEQQALESLMATPIRQPESLLCKLQQTWQHVLSPCFDRNPSGRPSMAALVSSFRQLHDSLPSVIATPAGAATDSGVRSQRSPQRTGVAGMQAEVPDQVAPLLAA